MSNAFPFSSIISSLFLNILVIYDFTLVIKSFLFFIFVFLCIHSNDDFSFFLYFYDVLSMMMMMMTTTIVRLFLFQFCFLSFFLSAVNMHAQVRYLSFGDICCGFKTRLYKKIYIKSSSKKKHNPGLCLLLNLFLCRVKEKLHIQHKSKSQLYMRRMTR